MDTRKPTAVTPTDVAYLCQAIAWAESVRATTSPNPGVGCVIVAGGSVIGRGATQPAGGAHAEVVALQAAGSGARGATAYVTLSPCGHVGRTPPCTRALLDAGVARVVVGLADPNPVAAAGVAILRDAGLVVDVAAPDSVVAAAIAAQLEGFVTEVASGRPHLTLKLAQTTAGDLVAPAGGRWVTSPQARDAVHRWRASVDAVLVGVGTIVADDPQLDVRRVTAAHQPEVVIFDTNLRTPVGANVVRAGTSVVTAAASSHRARQLERAGVQVIGVAQHRGRLILDDAMAALADAGLRTLFAEPGLTLSRALVEADLVDRLVLHIADHGQTDVSPAITLGRPATCERLGGAGPDAIVHWVRDRASEERMRRVYGDR